MMRVITISREYGSGGGTLARVLSERLHWRLIDDCLVAEIGKRGRASAEVVRAHEETVDPWFHRITKALWRGGFVGSASGPESEAWDADSIASLWHRVILESAELGECVIVGRGAQCLLQKRRDTFHVSVYAPMRDRLKRLREREAGDVAAAAMERDKQRAAYIKHHFDQEWKNPHLYHLMLCSAIGIERAADTVLCAAGLLPGGREQS